MPFELLENAIATYETIADPINAEAMESYLKNKFELYGIKSPARKEANKELFKTYGLPKLEELDKFVREAYALPKRDMQYLALEVVTKYVKKLPKEFIDTVEFMVTNKSWWDSVDWIATWHAGSLVKRFPELVETMDEWITDENMWLRRTAIIHQLKFKKNTDVGRLFRYCEACAHEKEFFIRKAIGWALREYSKLEGALVIEFIDNHEEELSGLSKREGLKWLKSRGFV
ncbi:DNA alkylation repair protein [Flammeovirgaceae bacterium SG7u.111]|nr:DNA alkylation repair protein [Flammeovirgaceae bacterium SG7u.132]WPO35236.1 DNA alkylation repair protein [Flammeovirgaceae bacterium SG7u.111]